MDEYNNESLLYLQISLGYQDIFIYLLGCPILIATNCKRNANYPTLS